ncbi:MAG: hypothetical protein ACRCZB_10505 [Bacteroidales bacterium]
MKRKRYSKTVAQQCKFYEVENIFEYMVSVYVNGNISPFKEMFRELCTDARKEFVEYLFSEVSPEYWEEIIISTI